MNEAGLRLRGHAAYFEPRRPADELATEAADLEARALQALRSGDRRSAEAPLRTAIERRVDAFLFDRAGHSECFVRAHVLGRLAQAAFGCRMSSEDGGETWSVECGVPALHSRLGISIGGTTRGRCSICQADDFGCSHVPGVSYRGERCVREVYEVDLDEISVVRFPEDPRTYRLHAPVTRAQVERAFGGRLTPGLVPECRHCVECDGADSGPRPEDLDQSLWDDRR